MTSEGFWNLFIETGDFVFYLLFRELLREETTEKTA